MGAAARSTATWVLVVAGAMLFARDADAYRPFDGTDADVADAGELELELGPLQAVRTEGANIYTPALAANYGFSERFELVLDLFGVVPLRAATGDRMVLSDVMVKYVLRPGSLQTATGPSIALETGPLLPNLPAHDTNGAGWSFALIASQRWSELTVHLTVEGVYERDREVTALASIIVEGPGRWAVRPVAELLAEHGDDRARIGAALVGAIWRVSDRVSFDAAARVERATDETSVEGRAGLTWTFEP